MPVCLFLEPGFSVCIRNVESCLLLGVDRNRRVFVC